MRKQIHRRSPCGGMLAVLLQRAVSGFGLCIACCFVSVWGPAAFAVQQVREQPADSVTIPQELWDAVLREGVANQTPGDAERQLLWQASASRRLRLTSEQALRFKQLCMDLARNAWWRGDTDSARQLMQTADWHAENLLVSSEHESFMLLDQYLQTAFWELHFGTPAAALQRLQICVTLQRQSGAMTPVEFLERLPLRQMLRLRSDEQFALLHDVLFFEGLPRLEGIGFQSLGSVPWPLLSAVQQEHQPLMAADDSTGKALHPLIMCLEAAVASGKDGELAELLAEPARRGNAASRYVLCCLQVMQGKPISTDWLLTAGNPFPAGGALLALMWQRPGYSDQVFELLSIPVVREQIFARRGSAGVLRYLLQSSPAGSLLSEAVADESWWGQSAGLMSLGNGQVAADGSDQGGRICLPFPVVGDFQVQCDVICMGGLSAGLGYGGIGFGISPDSRTLRIRSAGNHAPLIRSTPFTQGNIVRRVNLQVDSERAVCDVDGVEALNIPVGSSFPWITLHAEGPWPAVWRELSVSGDVRIPASVLLSGDRQLRGWSSLESGQTQPADPALNSTVRGARRESTIADRSDWYSEDGVIFGRPARGGSRVHPGVLRYLRALQTGDILAAELYLAPPQRDCLLAVGETLLGFTADGVRTGWFAASRQGRWLSGAGLPGWSTSRNPKLPLDPGWNSIVLRMVDKGIQVQINGEDAGQVALQQGGDTRFAVISPAGCQQTQIRNVVLSGDWPERWPTGSLTGLAGVTEKPVGPIADQRGLLGQFLSGASGFDLTHRLAGVVAEEQWQVLCNVADRARLISGYLPGAGRWEWLEHTGNTSLPRSLLEAFWELGQEQAELVTITEDACSVESARLWQELREFVNVEWSADSLREELTESAAMSGRERLARLMLLRERGTLSASAAACELLSAKELSGDRGRWQSTPDEQLRWQAACERADLQVSVSLHDQRGGRRERLSADDDWIPVRTGSIQSSAQLLKLQPEMIWARTGDSLVEAIRTVSDDILCWSKPLIGDCRLAFQVEYSVGSRPVVGVGGNRFVLASDRNRVTPPDEFAGSGAPKLNQTNGVFDELTVAHVIVQRTGNVLVVQADETVLGTVNAAAGAAQWVWVAPLAGPEFRLRDWDFHQAEAEAEWIHIDTGRELAGWFNSRRSVVDQGAQPIDGWSSEQLVLTGTQHNELHWQNWLNEIRLLRPLPRRATIRLRIFIAEQSNPCVLIGNIVLDIGSNATGISSTALPQGFLRKRLADNADAIRHVRTGEWNELELEVLEDRVSVRLNGDDAVGLEIGTATWRTFGFLQPSGQPGMRISEVQIQSAW